MALILSCPFPLIPESSTHTTTTAPPFFSSLSNPPFLSIILFILFFSPWLFFFSLPHPLHQKSSHVLVMCSRSSSGSTTATHNPTRAQAKVCFVLWRGVYFSFIFSSPAGLITFSSLFLFPLSNLPLYPFVWFLVCTIMILASPHPTPPFFRAASACPHAIFVPLVLASSCSDC